MKRHFDAVLVSAVLVMTTNGAMAHHSVAMFDREHPIELVGAVQEYRFASPHTYILLAVKGADARTVVWSLEGNSPNSLSWDGWSSKTLRPGDQLRVTIEPLRSGAPGGAWKPSNIRFQDGSSVATQLPH